MKVIKLTIILSLIASCSKTSVNDYHLKGNQRNLASETSNFSCSQSLTQLLEGTNNLPKYLENEVDLIWYPRAGYLVISHYEIRIEDTMYDATAGVKQRAKFDAAYRSAKSGRGKGFFRFKLAVTSDELENLRQFVQDPSNARRFQTCVGGVCHIVKNNTKIRIPFPFSQVPTLNAIYLTVMQKLGYQRILKVEYVGKSAWRNLISTAIPYELLATLGIGFSAFGFIVWAVNEAGEIVSLIIPVSDEKEVSTENE